eukprot:2146415-Rhodomonas_salina.1
MWTAIQILYACPGIAWGNGRLFLVANQPDTGVPNRALVLSELFCTAPFRSRTSTKCVPARYETTMSGPVRKHPAAPTYFPSSNGTMSS